jgi:hypothetical protein
VNLIELKERALDSITESIQESLELYSRQIEPIEGDNSYQCRKESLNDPYKGEKDAINNFMVSRITESGESLQRVREYREKPADLTCEIGSLVKLHIDNGDIDGEALYLITEDKFEDIMVNGVEVISLTPNSPIGGELFGRELNYEFSYGDTDFLIIEIA